MSKDAVKETGKEAKDAAAEPEKAFESGGKFDYRSAQGDKAETQKDSGKAQEAKEGIERIHPDLSPAISSAIEHRQEELGFRLEPENKDESALMELVYKALLKTKGHGADLDKSYDDKGLAYSGLKHVLKHLPLYTYDNADKLKAGTRESKSPFEVLGKFKDLTEVKDFVEKLRAEKLAATGKDLSKEDLKLLSPLSAKERQSLRAEQAYIEWFRTKANPEIDKVPGVRKEDYPQQLTTLEHNLHTKIEEKLGHSNHHQITEMLDALLDFKPSAENYLKLAKVGLLTQWDNHDGGVHYKKSPMLDSVFNAAEKDLSPEAFKEFMSMSLNYARAVDLRSALTHRAAHGLLWESPDAISMRNLLSTLDPENKKQVIEFSKELVHGDLQDEFKKRLESRDFYDLEETLTRKDKINPVGETMAALSNLEDRLKFSGFDDRKAFELMMAKATETGVIKRAALLSKEEWKELESRFQAEKGHSLADIAKIRNMPKAFAVFFEEMRQSEGNIKDYNALKKIIDTATSERRFDMASLALQISPAELRQQMQNDAANNKSGKSTMQETLDEFGKAVPFLSPDSKANSAVKFIRQHFQKEMLEDLFKDGELSLLTKVKANRDGLLHMNRWFVDYFKEHDMQWFSSNTSGIKIVFENASKEQIEKVQKDPKYAAELRKELQETLSNREAGILMSRLRGQETLTASLLELRPPGYLSLTDPKDFRYRRVLEEKVRQSDLEFWQKNIKNPEELSRLRQDLSTVYTAKQVGEILASMTAKFSDKSLTLEEIDNKRIGSRSLKQEISDARKPEDIVRAILRMSEAQANVFKEYNQKAASSGSELSAAKAEVAEIENLIAKQSRAVYKFADNAASRAKGLQEFCTQHLAAIKEGKTPPLNDDDPALSSIAMVKLNGLVNFGDPYMPLMAIRSAFDQVPGLKDELARKPDLKRDFEMALKMAVEHGNAGSYKDFAHVLEGKPLKIEELVKFASQWPDRRDAVFRFATEAEIKRLIQNTNDPKEIAWQNEILGPRQHAEVTKECLSKGYCDAADQARIASLSYKTFSENGFMDALYGTWRFLRPVFKSELPIDSAVQAYDQMDRSMVQESVADGLRRYHSLQSKDLYEASKVSERMPSQMAFTQSELGPRETTLTAFARRDAVRTPFWQMANDYLLGGKNGVEVEQLNTAMIKAMKELDDPETGIMKDIRALAGAIPDDRMKAELQEKIADFDKALKSYNGAEVALSERMKVMADIMSTALAVALWYTPIAYLPWAAEIGAGSRTAVAAAESAAGKAAAEAVVTIAEAGTAAAGQTSAFGARLADTALMGKLSAKIQIGASYWLNSSILRENMDSEATIKALVLFPAIQAKMLPLTHSLLPMAMRGSGMRIPMSKLALPHALHTAEHILLHPLDLFVKGGLIVGPPALYLANRSKEGLEFKNGFLSTSGDSEAERRKLIPRQLGLAVSAKLMEIGD